MPKRSIYLKDEEDQLYERVKQLTEDTGDTIGAVFVKAMQDYIAAKESEQQGLTKYQLFSGRKDPSFGDQGEYIEFIGKFIGEGVSYDPPENTKVTQTLFKTRKNKFAIYTQYNEEEVAVSRLEVIESIEQLKNLSLPSSITEALRKEKSAVRFLDI